MNPQKPIDLHIHSTFSDGTFSPEELVKAGKEYGLSAMALTDHDTIGGLDAFHGAGKKYDMETISGIEFAALYGEVSPTEIHIVGLGFHENDPLWKDALEALQKSRTQRNEKMVTALTAIGFPITLEEVANNAGGDIITRAHYANVLLEKGYIATKKEAFEKYISPGLPGYVERDFPTPAYCINLIKQTGGLAILAHPTLYHMTDAQIHLLIQHLIPLGLDGVEVEYSTYHHGQRVLLRNIAKKHDLLFSGGSDFHGANKPDIQLGIGKGNLYVPYSFWESMNKKRISRDF